MAKKADRNRSAPRHFRANMGMGRFLDVFAERQFGAKRSELTRQKLSHSGDRVRLAVLGEMRPQEVRNLVNAMNDNAHVFRLRWRFQYNGTAPRTETPEGTLEFWSVYPIKVLSV